MLVFRMLCRITQPSDAHRTESVRVNHHEQTVGVLKYFIINTIQQYNEYF